MARVRLADRIAHAMIEQDYGGTIMWGDGLLNDAAYGYVKGRRAFHPMNRMQAAVDALARAPDLFAVRHINAHDSLNRARVVRSFKLIGTPRPLDGKKQ